jgi:hypothetical protein
MKKEKGTLDVDQKIEEFDKLVKTQKDMFDRSTDGPWVRALESYCDLKGIQIKAESDKRAANAQITSAFIRGSFEVIAAGLGAFGLIKSAQINQVTTLASNRQIHKYLEENRYANQQFDIEGKAIKSRLSQTSEKPYNDAMKFKH